MRLIDADALKKEVNKKRVVGRFNMLLLIDNAPTVELFCSYLSDGEVRQPCVEAPCEHERPQGEWIIDNYGLYHCSNCNAIKEQYCNEFCAKCGSDMRGGKQSV